MTYGWVSFTTDYGIQDGFVAACEGVVARIAPSVRVIHVSHAVPAQDVRRGATLLASVVPYLPPAVHLAVVDPGVGTARRGVVLVTEGGLLVGPDNGLLVDAASKLGGIRAVHLLDEPAYRLPQVSATFHGRDIFAPAAAHLAAGEEPGRLGPAVDPATLTTLPEPETTAERGKLRTEGLGVDAFGNVQLGATAVHLAATGAQENANVHVHHEGRSAPATLARTFADVPSEEIVVYLDSDDRVALAVNRGSAAAALGVSPGDHVLLLFALP